MGRIPQGIRETALLIGRLTIGVIFIMHGLDKLYTNGMDTTVQGFTELGIPLPEISAWFAALVEILGGLAFVLGVALPLAAILLAVVTIGALVLVHLQNGFFVQNGGFEYVLALTGATLALGFNGGRYALSNAMRRDRQAALSR